MSMRNYSIYTLKTKLEFTNLYQYLSEKDYKQLEQQILCHSYHTPICTWNGIVINGIEAYELFRKHSIPFRIKRLHFSSKEDVISWICTDQLKREDLTNINKKYLIGKKYDAEKIIVSRQLSSTNKSHISGASIAAKKISEECNVAMATVYKYSAYSSALDIIDEKVPDFVKRVRSGQLWISQANIIELSGLPKEQLLSLNNYLLAEKIEHLSYHDMKRELLWNNYAKPMLRKESSVSIPSIRNLPQFDPDAEIANPVKVSRRDGINYVFNGQHTIEIVALVSGSRETPVWCMVYDDLVYTQEADIFANQMKYVKSLLPYEIFMANIEAGNDRELIIRDLVESYDLTITSSSRPGGICAVSTLINIYEKYGFHTLDRVLRLCVATWEGAPMSFSSNMLNAIARLDNAYGETMKDDTFKEKVGRVSVREISRTARERRAGSLGFAEALLLEYNKKSKYSLPFEKLYTHKTPKKREPSTEDESGQSSTPEGQLDLFSTDQENTQALPNE